MDESARSAPFPDPGLAAIAAAKLTPEQPLLERLATEAALDPGTRAAIAAEAAGLVRRIRESGRPGLMETLLSGFGLGTPEGTALMALAEALIRVPDAATADALIADRLGAADWRGRRGGALAGAARMGLHAARGALGGPLRGLAAPVIRGVLRAGLRQMGRQFVLGETIEAALARAGRMEGVTYSFDMLGEAAMTAADAEGYRQRYSRAIAVLGASGPGGSLRQRPGISVKLSALHPRYEVAQADRVLAELVPRLGGLCREAAAAGIGLCVDAEEADRLELSLEVARAALADPALAGWDGFGMAVQAYGRRAGPVIDWLDALAQAGGRRIAVRLVKGAYWDTEIKRAQIEGLAEFPVFTAKAGTDVSYLALARRLLARRDRLYPQFATHNAHTVAAVLHMAEGLPPAAWEFQRLHGMGAAMHDLVRQARGTGCRVYAPVGPHRDLLAYLVRRLLENGASASFVHQVADAAVPPEAVAADPFARVAPQAGLARGPQLFAPGRRNSAGIDLADRAAVAALAAVPAGDAPEDAAPVLAGPVAGAPPRAVTDPASGVLVGRVAEASAADVETALGAAREWSADAAARRAVLERASDFYEDARPQIVGLLASEAGKTLPDAVAEIREAVDFLRYYGAHAAGLADPPLGVVACISPWNFPLAIFTGQIAAALAAGNAVLAKPAGQTPLIAALAVRLLHRAGVPRTALQLLPGEGGRVGAALVADPRVAGVAFTGSTATALRIRAAMAAHLAPGAPLVAETGGLNAMIVDATALPEQAVRDIVASAFRSAGQRCSTLRIVYLQEEIADAVLRMLAGAMDELRLGHPGRIETDLGPLIDAAASAGVRDWIAAARAEGRLIHQIAASEAGRFVGPALIRVPGIGALTREVFGPVLHVARFRAEELGAVVAAINAAGYGLTFGLQSRIGGRIEAVAGQVRAGNLYVNRNQIGAVVGSQPFGGEGLSGTGPKAGGPHTLARLTQRAAPLAVADWERPADAGALRARLAAAVPGRVLRETGMPGPVGEENRLRLVARGPLLCLGPGAVVAAAQVAAVTALGGQAVAAGGSLAPELAAGLPGIAGMLWWGDASRGRSYAQALAARPGPILPLICGRPDAAHVAHERHLCIDTTAAGGNAVLLAGD